MRLACRQLVATLAPHFMEAGEGATWQEVIKKVHPEVGFNASKARAHTAALLREPLGGVLLTRQGYMSQDPGNVRGS